MKRFNMWFAEKITSAVSTMWCAYAFTCLALVSLPDAIRGGRATMVSWVAQTFLQLVLLSVVMVGQSLQSRSTEALIIDTHTLVLQELGILHDKMNDVHEVVTN